MGFNPIPLPVEDNHPATELGAAHRIADEWADTLRWSGETNKWLVYGRKAGVWVVDTNEDALNLATQSCRRHQDQYPTRSFERLGFIKNALGLAKPILAVSMDKFDSDPWILNTPTGPVDLMEGSATTSDGRYLLQTKVAPRRVPTPLWDKHLNDMTHGDKELQGYLQRAVGMSLIGDQSQKKHIAPVLNGRGRNGKGCFNQVLVFVLGDYGYVASSRTLTANEQAHTTEQKRLKGKRYVVVEEMKRINPTTFKMMTGGGEQTARDMRENDESFVRSWTFWLENNGTVHWGKDTSDGMWDRLKLVELGEGVPESQRKDDWTEQLKSEGEGILQWAIDGCAWYQQDGLMEPACVSSATGEKRVDADPLQTFLEERYERCIGCEVSASEFMDAFTDWCKRSSEDPPGGRNTVYADLRDRLGLKVGTKRGKNKQFVFGIKSRPLEFGALVPHFGEDMMSN